MPPIDTGGAEPPRYRRDDPPDSYTQEKLKAGVKIPAFLPYFDEMQSAGETHEMRYAYRRMLADPNIKASFCAKVFSVMALDLVVKPPENLKRDKRSGSIAEFLEWNYKYGIDGGVPGMVWEVTSGQLIDGFSVCEKVWGHPEPKGRWRGKRRLAALKAKDVDQDLVLEVDEFKNVTGVRGLRYNNGQIFDPRNFVICRNLGLFRNPTGMSDFRAAYGRYWLLDTAWKLRAMAVDKRAIPLIIGHWKDATQVKDLDKALAKARYQNWISAPADAQVEAINIAGSADQIFRDTIKDLREEIVMAIKGTMLSMMTSSDERGNSNVHKDTSDLFGWQLSAAFLNVLNDHDEGLNRHITDVNFTGVGDYSVAAFGGVDDKELKESLDIDRGLYDMDWSLSVEEMEDRYGRKFETDPTKAIRKPQPQPPGMPGAPPLGAGVPGGAPGSQGGDSAVGADGKPVSPGAKAGDQNANAAAGLPGDEDFQAVLQQLGGTGGVHSFSEQDWQGPNRGEQGGTFWVNRKSGEKKYQAENPGGKGGANEQEQAGSAAGTQPQAGAGASTGAAAKASKYAAQARAQFGDQAHEKLTAMAAKYGADQSPEGAKKLAAVNAMLGALNDEKAAAGAQGQASAAKTETPPVESADDSGVIDDLEEKWSDPVEVASEINTLESHARKTGDPSYIAEHVERHNRDLEKIGSDYRLYVNPDGESVAALTEDERKVVENVGKTHAERVAANAELEKQGGDYRISLKSGEKPSVIHVDDETSEWEDDDGEDIRDKWDDPANQVEQINSRQFAFDADDLATWNDELERVESDQRIIGNDDGQQAWNVTTDSVDAIAAVKDFSPLSISMLNEALDNNGDGHVKVSLASDGKPTFYDAEDADPAVQTESDIRGLMKKAKNRGDFHAINEAIGDDDYKVIYNGKYATINKNGIDVESARLMNDFGIVEAQGKETNLSDLISINEKLEAEGSWMLVPNYGEFKPLHRDDIVDWLDDQKWGSVSLDDIKDKQKQSGAVKYLNSLAEEAGSDIRAYLDTDGGYLALNLENSDNIAEELENNFGIDDDSEPAKRAEWINNLLEEHGSDQRVFYGNYSGDDSATFYQLPEDQFDFVSGVEATEDGVKGANEELEENGDDYRLMLRSGRIAIVDADDPALPKVEEKPDDEDDDDDAEDSPLKGDSVAEQGRLFSEQSILTGPMNSRFMGKKKPKPREKKSPAPKPMKPMRVGIRCAPSREPSTFSESGGGRWITIGGKKGEDGKRSGGSPVFIQDGRITKGHPSLTGKKIDALDKPVETRKSIDHGGTKDKRTIARREASAKAAETRKDNRTEAEYQRAVHAKNARKEGINPKHLHQLAGEIKSHHDAHGNDVRAMLKNVYSNHPHLKTATLSSNRGGDSAAMKNIDTISRSYAKSKEFSHLFGGYDADAFRTEQTGPDEDHSEKFYEYLVNGAPEQMDEADAYEQALGHLREHKASVDQSVRPAGKSKGKKPKARQTYDDAVPFSEGGDSLFEGSKHPRDSSGRWAEKGHIDEARKKLAKGELKVKTGDAVSHASGKPIKRYVELGNGAKIHPDELHRTKFGDGDEPYVSGDEQLTVTDGTGTKTVKSFALAAAHAGMSRGTATISGPHGYSITLPGAAWKAIVKDAKAKSFSDWADEQNPKDLAAKTTAHAAKAKPLTEVVGGKDADDFFAGRPAGQARLFSEQPPRKFSSTQFDLARGGYSRSQGNPAHTILNMAAAIPDADLAADGRETRPHVTVKYGLHTNDADEVSRIVKDFGVVQINLGKTSIFPAKDGGEYDVVKIDVESDQLQALNARISKETECTDTHPVYMPHVTIAYVKAGLGEKYVGSDLVEGQTLSLHRLVFSNKDRVETVIDLLPERLWGFGQRVDAGESRDAELLADFYAKIWNALPDRKPSDSSMAAADDELRGSGHTVNFDSGANSWHVVREAPVDEFAEQARSPKGGVSINGKHYRGGQWIPAEQMALADADTKKKIEDAQTERTNARKSRGTVNAAKLRDNLKAHAGQELAAPEMKRAKRMFAALKNHHGELLHHRLEELADELQKAHDAVDNEVQREYFAKQLKAIDAMLEWAGDAPEVEKPETPKVLEVAIDPEAQPTTPEAAAAIPEPEDTPRTISARVEKATDAAYEFARISAVGNFGDDLKGSARHKANTWRGLAHAEETGTAAELVTRSNLFKVEPHTLLANISPKNGIPTLAANLALNAFPAEPGTYPANYALYRNRNTGEPLPPPKTASQLREQYLDAYREIKGECETAAGTETDAREVLNRVRAKTLSIINRLRKDDHYNPVANGLIDLFERTKVPTYGRPRKNDAMGRVLDFVERVQKKYPGEPSVETLEKIVGHVSDVIEGDSFNKTFGTQGASNKRFDPAEAYVANAERKGGRAIDASTVESGKNFMLDRLKLRGVQWGNYVTDDERHHHLTKSSEALADLADLTGLPDEAVSLGGKLGLAIGARGMAGARAHYEPSTQVINLTRASGVGSLAHEWGHALDNFLGEFKDFHSDRYLSKAANDPTAKAMQDVHREMAGSGYRTRLIKEVRERIRKGELPGNAEGYWASPTEMFARSFERHLQDKLHADERENTYLVGLRKDGHPLWPNREESARIGKAMDALMKAVRDKHFTGAAGSADVTNLPG